MTHKTVAERSRWTRGGLTAKIHAIVDALANPVELSLTPGQASDLDEAEPLLEDIDPKAFPAGKADDAAALIEVLEDRDIVPAIKPKADRVNPRETDFALNRERHLIEGFFNKIKHYRATATRYNKLANTFLAAMQLVAIVILLNRRHTRVRSVAWLPGSEPRRFAAGG